MDITNPWVQFGIHVVVGTLAGGLTDTVAVWLLFNPRKRRFGLHGAIPKNQARLARSIGKTVGQRLLTPPDIQRELSRPELQAAFEIRLTELVRSILVSQEPLIAKVPPAVVNALESALTAYLPVAMQKLGGFLGQPTTREKMRAALHGLFNKFVADLQFHERVMAKLFVTESKLERVLDAVEQDGVEQLVVLLDDPTIREEITRTIHDTILDYLRLPITEILGQVTDVDHPDDSAPRIARAMTPVIWAWIYDQVPGLVQRLDLQNVVEKKVIAFDTERVEEIIRGVMQDELNLIIIIGYGLGAVVGVCTFFLSRALGL